MEDSSIKKQVVVSGILVAVISAVLLLISGLVYNSIERAQKREARQYMNEIVSQYKNIITAKIDGNLQTLGAVATFVGESDNIDLDLTLACLEAESSRNEFVRMGFVSLDGTGYFIDADGTKHYDVDVSDEPFIQESLDGHAAVSDIMEDRLSDTSIICYSVPVTHNGTVTGVISASNLVTDFSEIISQEIFDGVAYVHIVDREGTFIVRSDHAVIQKPMDNIFDRGEITDDTKKEILADIGKGKDSFAIFDYKGSSYWATFIPIGIHDWQIFCLVPQTFLNHNFNTLLTVFWGVMVCIFLLFTILFFYIYKMLKKGRQTLQIFAYKDMLTGADNRNNFIMNLPVHLNTSSDHAMVLMNISGFKFVNEFFGFEAGNQLLIHIAAVLSRNIEAGELYYRDNADRFGMFLLYDTREKLIQRIEKIDREINAFVVSPNQDYHILCNFGISIITPEDAKDDLNADTVINRAVLALNSVNGSTASLISFYDEELHKKARNKTEIESQMHAALADGEFHMYLQPKYLLKDHTLHSAEALARWYTSDGVVHYPDEFIPVFEQNGFVTQLDMYMLEEACKRVSYWISQGYPAVPISVNQSRIFFYDEEYLDKFHEIVDQYHLDPSLIILEVTESVAMSNLSQVKKVIEKLHKMGFAISMDDFGSGYSSLNTLKDLDIAELKLDKEFLSEQSTSPRGQMIIKSMIRLARDLSITTVAEGIETEVQLEFLKKVSCDIGQGYLFARPMPVEEFEQRIFPGTNIQSEI